MNYFENAVFPLFFLQIPAIEKPENVNYVLAWGLGIMVSALAAIATIYIRAQAKRSEDIAELNKEHTLAIAELNKELRELYEKTATKTMEWKSTLEKTSEAMSVIHPEIRDEIKETRRALVEKLDRYHEELRRYLEKK